MRRVQKRSHRVSHQGLDATADELERSLEQNVDARGDRPVDALDRLALAEAGVSGIRQSSFGECVFRVSKQD